jgi:inward rectifier potassium channel
MPQPPTPPTDPNLSPMSAAATGEETRDLGFGSIVSQQRDARLLNRDGSFNVRRKKPSPLQRLTSYHGLMTASWPVFVAWVLVLYLLLNTAFAAAYMAAGKDALQGDDFGLPFLRAFFFSVETFSTIGFGNIAPKSIAAHVVMTAESMVGLLGFALVTGVVFARFARPTAHIIYSRHAVIAPYHGITAFEFRIVNGRDNQIIDLSASVVLTRFESEGNVRQRRYYPLPLERPSVAFFPLTWTVVHPIDRDSPLWGWNDEQLHAAQAEFLVLLRGIDETFAQTVQGRSSYTAAEVKWGMKFASVFHQDGILTLDMRRFHQLEPAPLPETHAAAALR